MAYFTRISYEIYTTWKVIWSVNQTVQQFIVGCCAHKIFEHKNSFGVYVWPQAQSTQSISYLNLMIYFLIFLNLFLGLVLRTEFSRKTTWNFNFTLIGFILLFNFNQHISIRNEVSILFFVAMEVNLHSQSFSHSFFSRHHDKKIFWKGRRETCVFNETKQNNLLVVKTTNRISHLQTQVLTNTLHFTCSTDSNDSKKFGPIWKRID